MHNTNSFFICFFINSLFIAKVYPGRQRALINLQTSFGDLVGVEEITDFGDKSRSYHAFKGIPYAVPPIGSLRWKDPILASPRANSTSYATDYKPICTQWGTKKNQTGNEIAIVVGSEDCLYLNVFVSQPVIEYKNVLLPVMVFIHGGAFQRGGSSDYGPEKLMTQDVILVTLNYRLGAFGYLSTGDHELPGNYGSLDQITALKWIRKYIKDFGGNSHKITVFGNSAGAMSVHQLLLSPLAKGLFHAAILQSGTTFCENFSIIEDPLSVSKRVAAGLFCPIHNGTETMVQCLKRKSVHQIMYEQRKLTPKWILPIHLAPVVDGYSRTSPFLPHEPIDLPIVNQVPIMLGMTRDEGLLFYTNMVAGFSDDDISSFVATKERIWPHFLKSILKEENDDIIHNTIFRIIQFYGRFRYDSIGASIQALNGLYLGWCQRRAIEQLSFSSHFPVFSYVFGYREKTSPTFSKPAIQQVELKGIEHPFFDYGVGHQDELYYLFQMAQEDNPMGFRDSKMAIAMTEMWAAFATFGSPAAAIESLYWPPWFPVLPHGRIINSYFINLRNPHTEFNFRWKEYKFFNYLKNARGNHELHNQNYTRQPRFRKELFYELE